MALKNKNLEYNPELLQNSMDLETFEKFKTSNVQQIITDKTIDSPKLKQIAAIKIDNLKLNSKSLIIEADYLILLFAIKRKAIYAYIYRSEQEKLAELQTRFGNIEVQLQKLLQEKQSTNSSTKQQLNTYKTAVANVLNTTVNTIKLDSLTQNITDFKKNLVALRKFVAESASLHALEIEAVDPDITQLGKKSTE
jgi:hypothetical protein